MPSTASSASSSPSCSSVWTSATTPVGVLRAMAVDGLLVEVVPAVWLPADLADDQGARAAALVACLTGAGGAPVAGCPPSVSGAGRGSTRGSERGAGRGAVPAGAVVAMAAAAWVHGCPTPPRRVDLLVPRGTGPGGPGGPVRLRRVVDPARDACTVGGLLVTGPARTVEDLLLSPDPDDRAAREWATGGPQAPACSSRRPVAR